MPSAGELSAKECGQRERHGPHLAEQAQRRARETELCLRCFRQRTRASLCRVGNGYQSVICGQ